VPRVVHFEIPAGNTERAVKFYTEVFGWKAQKWEGGQVDYYTVETGARDEPGIDGGITAAVDEKAVVDYLQVPDVDAYVKKIEPAGGKMLTPKMPIPGMGYFANFRDTEGNRMGIFQEDPSAKMDD
jgi:predicted enzyme related to lactoylglutathione lyase